MESRGYKLLLRLKNTFLTLTIETPPHTNATIGFFNKNQVLTMRNKFVEKVGRAEVVEHIIGH
jgi:hypothetical protein